CFFFQAEDGIRDFHVTGVQTCALPILETYIPVSPEETQRNANVRPSKRLPTAVQPVGASVAHGDYAAGGRLPADVDRARPAHAEIGRASCRERVRDAAGGAARIKTNEG